VKPAAAKCLSSFRNSSDSPKFLVEQVYVTAMY